MSILVPILLAVVPAVVAALIGVVTYRNQKRTDRQVDLKNLRMKGYERYLTAFRGYSSLYDFDPPPADNSAERIKAINEYWLAYSNLFQLASDPVLLAVTNFHKLAWMQDMDLTGKAYDEEFKDLYATMIMTMRKDAFEETELEKERVAELLPFNFSQVGKTAPSSEQQSNAAAGEMRRETSEDPLDERP
jgi:hypothetical protein